MSDVDAEFLEVLESCTGAEGEVDYSDDGWKPPDGEYTVLLERFTQRSKDKDGVKCGMGNAVFKILAGGSSEGCEGKMFGEFFWLPSQARVTTPGMSSLLRLGTIICGRDLKVAEIVEASQHITDACGTAVINVRVSTTTAKNKKTYTNTRFLQLVAEDEPAVA